MGDKVWSTKNLAHKLHSAELTWFRIVRPYSFNVKCNWTRASSISSNYLSTWVLGVQNRWMKRWRKWKCCLVTLCVWWASQEYCFVSCIYIYWSKSWPTRTYTLSHLVINKQKLTLQYVIHDTTHVGVKPTGDTRDNCDVLFGGGAWVGVKLYKRTKSLKLPQFACY